MIAPSWVDELQFDLSESLAVSLPADNVDEVVIELDNRLVMLVAKDHSLPVVSSIESSRRGSRRITPCRMSMASVGTAPAGATQEISERSFAVSPACSKTCSVHVPWPSDSDVRYRNIIP